MYPPKDKDSQSILSICQICFETLQEILLHELRSSSRASVWRDISCAMVLLSDISLLFLSDLVGDNVGDCAARGADLFESIGAEIISAMILGGTMAKRSGIENPEGFILFPLVVHALDLVVSAAGILSISSTTQRPREDPYDVLKSGYMVALGLAVICFGVTTKLMLDVPGAPNAWLHFLGCGLVGILSAYCFVFIAQVCSL